jgi:hypothetical protein
MLPRLTTTAFMPTVYWMVDTTQIVLWNRAELRHAGTCGSCSDGTALGPQSACGFGMENTTDISRKAALGRAAVVVVDFLSWRKEMHLQGAALRPWMPYERGAHSFPSCLTSPLCSVSLALVRSAVSYGPNDTRE